MRLGFTSDYLLNPLIKLIYPDVCQKCGELLSFGEVLLCKRCFDGLEFQPYFSKETYINVFRFSSVFSLGIHDGFLREFIHKMKYESCPSIGMRIILKAYNLGLLPMAEYKGKTLIPVPLHPSRLRERGFNQSELIGRALSEVVSCNYLNLLRRVKYTKPMVELNPKERESNIKGAFKVKGRKVPISVILVDDVLTTGSTISECAYVLNNAGCKEIGLFTISRAS